MVIVTGTASGKTLCYNLPVLNNLIQGPASRALYLFPTKALAQDQKEVLTGLVHDTWNISENDIFSSEIPTISVYDGDTPSTHRSAIRTQVKVSIDQSGYAAPFYIASSHSLGGILQEFTLCDR